MAITNRVARKNPYTGRVGAAIQADGSLSDGSGMVAAYQNLQVETAWLGSTPAPVVVAAGATVTVRVFSISDFSATSIRFPSEIAANLMIKSIKFKQANLLPSENLIPCSNFTEVATNNADLQFEESIPITSSDSLDVELVNISAADKSVVFSLTGNKVGQ